MKRIYQLSFAILITLLFGQCDDSEKLAKPHLSLSELQEKVSSSEAFINFRATTVQNLTNSFNNIAELNKDDRHMLKAFVEKYGDVDDFTKNATKEERDQFARLTKVTEVENTELSINTFESFVGNLRRDFDFSQENLSLVILEGLFDNVETIKNQRRGCIDYCEVGAADTYVSVLNSSIGRGGMGIDSAINAATIASSWYMVGCLDGCADIME